MSISNGQYFELTLTTTPTYGGGVRMLSLTGGDSVSTPEPASVVVWGLVIAGGLVVARRRKA